MYCAYISLMNRDIAFYEQDYCKHPLVINTVQFNGQFDLLCMQYLSPVLHLLFSICQPFASLLLLSEGFLGLCTEIHIFNDFADLFPSFGGAFTVARVLICILFITLLKYRKIQQAIWPLDTGAKSLFPAWDVKFKFKVSEMSRYRWEWETT